MFAHERHDVRAAGQEADATSNVRTVSVQLETWFASAHSGCRFVVTKRQAGMARTADGSNGPAAT